MRREDDYVKGRALLPFRIKTILFGLRSELLNDMKNYFWVGLICVVLGFLTLVVPVPHTEQQTFQSGSISLGVSRTGRKRVPPVAGSILIVCGLGLMVVGCREHNV